MNRLRISLVSIAAVFFFVCVKGLAQEEPETTPNDEQAKALALRVHSQAAAMDKLERFHYEAHNRVSEVYSMRDVECRSVEFLKKALDEPVRKEDLNNETVQVYAWDEAHFLFAHRLLKAGVSDGESEHHYFGIESRAWHRSQRDDGPAGFVFAHTNRIWGELQQPALGYFQVTPHYFWWGDTTQGQGKTHSPVPPRAASYRYVGAEPFGGEMCDVVESAGRKERLWVGCKSGRLRGVLQYSYQGRFEPPFYQTEAIEKIAGRTFSSQDEFRDWHDQSFEELAPARKTELAIGFNEMYFEPNGQPHALFRFDDYRQVAPDVWIPFRVVRSWPSSYKEPKGQYHYNRSESVVQDVKTDFALSKTIAGLTPKEGERIQDQRYWPVWVNYDYHADRTEEDILKLVASKQQEIAKSRRMLKQLTEPIEAMVGKPAPELPTKGWIGGTPPKLDGTPYLIHFWATWCGPCKNDLPLLKKLAADGATIVGIHPPGTPKKEVKKSIAEEELLYPTLLVSRKGEEIDDLAGFAVKMYPYCVIVDDEGQVAAHGRLRSKEASLLGILHELRKGGACDPKNR